MNRSYIIFFDSGNEPIEKLENICHLHGVLVVDYSSPDDVLKEINRNWPLALIAGQHELVSNMIYTLREHDSTLPLIVSRDVINDEERLNLVELGADDVISTDQLQKYMSLIFKRNNISTVKDVNHLMDTSDDDAGMKIVLKKHDLSNIIQFLTMSRRIGKLEITFNNSNRNGFLITDENGLVDAETEGKTGIPAIALMLQSGEGTGRFFDGVEADKTTLSGPIDHILLEASMIADHDKADYTMIEEVC